MEKSEKKGPSALAIIGIVFAGLFGLCLLGGVLKAAKDRKATATPGGSGGSSSTPTTSSSGSGSSGGTGSSGTQVQAVSVPSDQAAFVAALRAAGEDYKAAPNELKKSAIRTARSKQIEAAFKGARNVSDWIGTLAEMKTNGDGKAIVQIKLYGSEVVVKTWNNALSDVADHTLIPQDSALFKAIGEMSVGDAVTFAATFVAAEKDFVKECSMTEAGSMREPEFIAVFKDIKRR